MVRLFFILTLLAPLLWAEAPFAPILGPAIISTVETAESQAATGKRPTYYQPKEALSPTPTTLPLKLEQGEKLVFLGNSLAERMLFYDHFESALHAAFPEKQIVFRNLGFPAHTPAFRPFAGRKDPWAFPKAKRFRPEINRHLGKGHYPSPDEWLTILQADTIVAFFGFNESFSGPEGLPLFKEELAAFVAHTKKQAYNWKRAPRLVLATPIGATNGFGNEIIGQYAAVIKEVATNHNLPTLDLFEPSQKLLKHTINGVHLDDIGYQKLTPILMEQLFDIKEPKAASSELKAAIAHKNWHWRNDYRMPNGVHVYGERWNPYGNKNYPAEIEKNRQLTVLGDRQIWLTAQGKAAVTKIDLTTRPIPETQTNYRPSKKNGTLAYAPGEESLKTITTPEGYRVQLFADEKQFPNLANPMQMRFDNEGRLWVATMPSYPHYQPGGPRPDDKILIYEDLDQDGKADRETIFARGLSLPIGFDFADRKNSIYLSASTRLLQLTDTDGDNVADQTDYLLDGFDPHDSHHSFSAFTNDASGALFMLEGRFLHSQIETPFGPQRCTDGGVWRWEPKTFLLERFQQYDVSNPWGMVHDEYGQNILNDASGGRHHWMAAYNLKVPHGREMSKVAEFNYNYRIRPTSGSEILRSSHFPDDVQGDYLFGNTIGFLGIAQLRLEDYESVRRAKFVQNLVESSDTNFRPADLEIAPDGSLYFIDWHNALIGHMQHSARDPHRSTEFGRIYRVTYPSRPLVAPPRLEKATVKGLFENFRLPELNARKRTHRELRRRNKGEVAKAALAFAQDNASDERLVFEALRATWGTGKVDSSLLDRCLAAKDPRVRASSVRIVRHSLGTLSNPGRYLLAAASDPADRVRLEALGASTWLGGKDGARVFLTVASAPRDRWINNALNTALYQYKPEVESLLADGTFYKDKIADFDLLMEQRLRGAAEKVNYISRPYRQQHNLDRTYRAFYNRGKEVFLKEGSCSTCHQPDGKGLKNIYPPLAKSEWIIGNPERLAKLTLHGLMGPIKVNGVDYPGQVPMTAVGQMFPDDDVAAVLTYVRHSFGNEASPITPDFIKSIRAATEDRQMFYTAEELLKEHPFPE